MKPASDHRFNLPSIYGILLLSTFWWLALGAPRLSASPAVDEAYRYQETTGETIKAVSWQLVKGDTYVLTTTSPTSRHVTTTSPAYDTLRWRLIDRDAHTDLTAARHGNGIILRGRFKGDPIAKRLEIDASPWYQATSLSLRGFVASEDAKRDFWTIRLGTMTAHKIRAIKKEVRCLDTDGTPRTLMRVRLTLPGMMSPFWRSDCWFDVPDGVLFRFEGPSGPPGSPQTTVTRTDG